MTISINQLENETFEDSDIYEIPPPDVVAYTEARSCADLFRMYTQNILNIQPSYEREFVWSNSDQTRFIDSLIKQLPIPSMCFSYDANKQLFQVIDGLQRMSTIVRFLKGTGWTLSRLKDIDPTISGVNISKFTDKNSRLNAFFKRVENLTLPVTILRCDYSKKNHNDYIFMIFHRLNHGGSKLTNQEIRNCIYSGLLNDILKELNKNSDWMNINNMEKSTGYRFRKEEIILRFFAFYDEYKSYGGRLAKFLNDYMYVNRNPSDEFLRRKRSIFIRTVSIVNKSIFEGKPPKKLTTTVLEATLIGVALNIDFLETQTNETIKNMYNILKSKEEFSDIKLREGLSGEKRVIGRLDTAKKVFSSISND
jgi:hypothetical protein